MATNGPNEEPDSWSQLPPIDHDALDAEDDRLDDLEDAEEARRADPVVPVPAVDR